MKKKFLSLALALVLCLGLSLPAAASDMGKVGTYTTISAGHSHTGAVDQSGTLWMWGANKFSQLGNRLAYDTEYWTGNYQSIPVKVLDDVASISCGNSHTAAIKTDGSLWMWGFDKYGQIGVGGNVDFKDESIPLQLVPVKVMDGVAAVSCGEYFTAAIKTDGSLWTWGSNLSGQIGNGGGGNVQTEYGTANQNVPVKILDNVAAVSCGWDHAAAIKTDGSLWTWGDGSYFKLGNGLASNIYDDGMHGDNQLVPIKVMDGVAAVSCGREFTAAIKTDGSLWMWGNNVFGQVGSGSSNYTKYNNACQSTPVKIMDGVSAVGCGEYFTVAIKTNGSLWAWGYNWDGQLGNGGKGNVVQDAGERQICQTVPVKVMDNVAAVSCGGSHTVVVKTDGSLWTCGANYYGQLGNGNQGNFHSTTWPNSPSQDIFGKIMDNIKLPKSSLPSIPAAPSSQTAQPSTDKLTVDGKSQVPTAYKIGGNNYFKLRDVAAMLSGTSKQFSVGYDGSVILTTGQPYQSVGGELSGPASGVQSASVSNNVVYINGVKAELTAYQIGGNNYFKLRDLGKALNFYVGWSQERGVYIETDKPYQD